MPRRSTGPEQESKAVPGARSRAHPAARLKPDQEDRLTQFRLKLQFLFGVEWTNSDILQWLFREDGESWLTKKCEEAAAQKERDEKKASP